MNLVGLLEERARLHPERLALVDSKGGKDRVVSYQELLDRIETRAGFLRKIGLVRGQTLLVFQPVSIELYEILLAAFHSGIQVMMADPSAGRKFLSLCCGRVMPDAFVGSWKAQLLRWWVPELRSVRRAMCTQGWFPGSKAWQGEAVRVPMMQVKEDAPALITFTSGSTGVPKAAVRSHGFLLAQHAALSRAMHFEEGEVDLITLPVFVLANLASGLTSVLAATDLGKPGAPDVAAISAQCERFQVTRCAASPAFFEAFHERVPPLEKIYTGGAPVFPSLLWTLRQWLPEAQIYSVYGSTEAEPIAHFAATLADLETDTITRAGGGLCSGVPVPELELMIISNQFGKTLGPMSEAALDQLAVVPGQAGEIIVSGNHVLKSYLSGMGDQETKISTGERVWHRTGDAGWRDRQGRLWLLGRAAEKLPDFAAPEGLPNEAWCYPFAIECALRERFPGIRMAALGWKGARTLIVGKEMLDGEKQQLAEAAEGFGMTRVCYINAIPLDRRHQAKIDYPALRKLLETLILCVLLSSI